MKKQVDFVLSNTYLSSFYGVLDNIKQIINKDKTQSIILVVPDKFSLNAEQLVFCSVIRKNTDYCYCTK